jgi:hypothetical protein
LSDKSSKIEQEFCNRLNAKLAREKDPPYLCLPATMNLPVLYKDGTFKTKPVPAESELFLSEVRLGSRDNLIWRFKPADAQEYEFVEIKTELISEKYHGIVSYASEAVLGVVHEDTTIQGTLILLGREIKKEEELKKQQEKDEAELLEIERMTIYENNPEWGLF